MHVAFSSAMHAAIAAGDQSALMRGLAATCALWFRQCDTLIERRGQIGASHVVAPGVKGALLAAALDLHDVLVLSPQGQEAIADLSRRKALRSWTWSIAAVLPRHQYPGAVKVCDRSRRTTPSSSRADFSFV